MTGSEIFQRIGEHVQGEALETMLRYWRGNPEIAEVFTGPSSEDRSNDMRWWLNETMGPQAWPFGESPRQGRWLFGSATVHGWTWVGFADEADMLAFFDQFPAKAER